MGAVILDTSMSAEAFAQLAQALQDQKSNQNNNGPPNNDGGGNSGGGSGGNGPRDPGRDREHEGWLYSKDKERQVETRGTTFEEVAGLPYRSIWEATTIDRARGEAATAYFGSSRQNDYNVYNEERREIVQIGNRIDPDFVPDDVMGSRVSRFPKVMRSVFGRERGYRRSPRKILALRHGIGNGSF